jgi:membrane-associated protease RseP (regulator of RpoE activity)
MGQEDRVDRSSLFGWIALGALALAVPMLASGGAGPAAPPPDLAAQLVGGTLATVQTANGPRLAVTSLAPGATLRVGDVIEKANGTPIRSCDALDDEIRHDDDGIVEIDLLRARKPLHVFLAQWRQGGSFGPSNPGDRG